MSDAHDIADLIAGELKVSRATAYEMMRETLSKIDGEAQTTEAASTSKPLITTEASLRFRLESEKEKSAGYLDEIRELKGRIELGKKVWREDQQRIAELSARIDGQESSGFSVWHLSKDGLPPVGSEVIGGHFYTDTWLKDKPEVFGWGRCTVIADDHSDFPDGKRWHTFGPSHNEITHWSWPLKKPQGAGCASTENSSRLFASVLSSLKPATQEAITGWLADGTFVERAIGAMKEQEIENMRLEKILELKIVGELK